MYYKAITIKNEETKFNKDSLHTRLLESASIKQAETIKDGIYGRDEKENFFLIRVLIREVDVNIEIESEDYELMRGISEIITEDYHSIGDSSEENLFSYIRKMSGDIKVIKNIMIFYLIVTIIGFIFGFLSLT